MSKEPIVDDQSEKIDNELIAEFMGRPMFPLPEYRIDYSEYKTSWNALIPVAQKIKTLVYKDIKNMDLPVFSAGVSRWHPIQNEIGNLKIEAARYCIVKFIQWYNSQKK